MQLYPQLGMTLGPDGMRNFNKYVFFPLFLNDPSLIDIMFPKTVDELKADEENAQLAKDIMPDVLETDDHETHIFIHRQLMPKTNAAWFHLGWHEDLLAKQKQLIMQQQVIEQSMGALEGGKPQVGAEKKNPLEAASPLKAETKNSSKSNY